MQGVRQGRGRRADRRLADAARAERAQALAGFDDEGLDLRRRGGVRDDVAGEAGRLAHAVYQGEIFAQRVADALRHRALDLALDALRVDRPPNVMAGRVLENPNLPGIQVDLDLGR